MTACFGRFVVAASIGALAGLPGCGGTDAVKPSPLPEFKATAEARVAWRASVGSSKRYVFYPALRGGAIYAAAHDGTVARLDAANGKQVWRTKTDQQLSGGVGADSDLVVVAGVKGMVVAFGLDGKELWRSQVSSEVLSVPRAIGELVIVRAGDGHIFGLDAANGERKWEYQAKLPPLLLRAESGITPLRNVVSPSGEKSAKRAARTVAVVRASGRQARLTLAIHSSSLRRTAPR